MPKILLTLPGGLGTQIRMMDTFPLKMNSLFETLNGEIGHKDIMYKVYYFCLT